MKSRVHNPKYLEKYFTQFPNIIDDYGLSPFEFRLIIHYYRVGECWEGVRKTSEICKMSTGKVSTCRKSLEEKGLIRTEQKGDGVIIYLTDLSKDNLEKYRSCGEQLNGEGVHDVNQDRSHSEHKKNHSKKNSCESKDSPQEVLFTDGLKPDNKLKPTKEKQRACYGLMVDFWLKEFHSGWTFGAIHGKSIKSIIKKVETTLKAGGNVNAEKDEVIVNFFKIMCQNLPEWFRDKDLPILDSKYNEIIHQIQAGPKKDLWNSRPSASSVFGKYATE